jgi:hypothetical protein
MIAGYCWVGHGRREGVERPTWLASPKLEATSPLTRYEVFWNCREPNPSTPSARSAPLLLQQAARRFNAFLSLSL